MLLAIYCYIAIYCYSFCAFPSEIGRECQEELKRATVELRIRRRDHPALAKAQHKQAPGVPRSFGASLSKQTGEIRASSCVFLVFMVFHHVLSRNSFKKYNESR